MAKHGGGAIVNVGTVGSLLASPNELPYACAKAGLNALTVGLAEAFAPTVRVNAILPGAFDTDVTRAWTDEMRSGDYVPLGRLGQPSEIVGAAIYLASDAGQLYHRFDDPRRRRRDASRRRLKFNTPSWTHTSLERRPAPISVGIQAVLRSLELFGT